MTVHRERKISAGSAVARVTLRMSLTAAHSGMGMSSKRLQGGALLDEGVDGLWNPAPQGGVLGSPVACSRLPTRLQPCQQERLNRHWPHEPRSTMLLNGLKRSRDGALCSVSGDAEVQGR